MSQSRQRRTCPGCGRHAVRHLLDNTMASLDGLDLSYRVGDCQACGFSFAYELPDDATYERYYRTLSKYDVSATLSPADHLRFSTIVDLVRQYLATGAMLIDIGCGEGALLALLRGAGFSDVHGLDPAANASMVARDKYALNTVRTGFFHDAAAAVDLARADGVIIAAVLEHLPGLRRDLLALLGAVKPGCIVFIEVPSLEFFGTGVGEPFGEFSLEHVNYFCRDSLVRLMGSLGWTCLGTRELPFPELETGSVLAAFVLAERLAGPLDTALSAEPQARLDAYIADSERILQGVLQRVPAGRFIVYGAGSHSARLLPRLPAQAQERIAGVVDGNANLTGKPFGAWTVQPPAWIANAPDLPILVSSFRAQNDIATSLRAKFPNPLVLLY